MYGSQQLAYNLDPQGQAFGFGGSFLEGAIGLPFFWLPFFELGFTAAPPPNPPLLCTCSVKSIVSTHNQCQLKFTTCEARLQNETSTDGIQKIWKSECCQLLWAAYEQVKANASFHSFHATCSSPDADGFRIDQPTHAINAAIVPDRVILNCYIFAKGSM